MGMPGRMTLCNMAIEMGAKAGIVPPDATTWDYVRARRPGATPFELASDPDATFAETRTYDASALEPQVAVPHNVDNVVPVSKVAGTHVDQVFIGSCTNGRFEDLAEAAEVLGDRSFSDAVRVIVIPASRDEYLKALRAGLIERFVDGRRARRGAVLRALHGRGLRPARAGRGLALDLEPELPGDGRARPRGWSTSRRRPRPRPRRSRARSRTRGRSEMSEQIERDTDQDRDAAGEPPGLEVRRRHRHGRDHPRPVPDHQRPGRAREARVRGDAGRVRPVRAPRRRRRRRPELRHGLVPRARAARAEGRRRPVRRRRVVRPDLLPERDQRRPAAAHDGLDGGVRGRRRGRGRPRPRTRSRSAARSTRSTRCPSSSSGSRTRAAWSSTRRRSGRWRRAAQSRGDRRGRDRPRDRASRAAASSRPPASGTASTSTSPSSRSARTATSRPASS